MYGVAFKPENMIKIDLPAKWVSMSDFHATTNVHTYVGNAGTTKANAIDPVQQVAHYHALANGTYFNAPNAN